MKTFNEFINEGQQFLRSIGKNDNVIAPIPVRELKVGDWFYYANDFLAIRHVQIIDMELENNAVKFAWKRDNCRYHLRVEFSSIVNEFTAIGSSFGSKYFLTTDKDEFIEYIENDKRLKDKQIIEVPAK